MPEAGGMQNPEAQELRCTDGYVLGASLWRGGPDAIVIAPALGVPQGFYHPFAAWLHAQGYTALVFDYRGGGKSARGPVRGRDMLMQDWGALDIEAALRYTREKLGARKLFLVGHSAGGQLPGLAPAAESLTGIVMVAASAPHASLYPMPFKLSLLLTFWLLVPALSLARDVFPARRVGLGSVDVPAGVIAQWARWGRRRGYLFNPQHGLDVSRYARLRTPILSFCFADDTYATEAAVEALVHRYSAAPITRRSVTPGSGESIGHFGFFRDKHRDTLWRETAQWLGSA